MISRQIKLKVRSAQEEDVYKDIVRISQNSRHGLKTGKIHRFKADGNHAYFILRGTGPENDGKLLIDEAARSKLSLSAGAEREFLIEEVGWWGELVWMWEATDPTYRVAGRLGVLSLLLGLLAFAPLIYSALNALHSLIVLVR